MNSRQFYYTLSGADVRGPVSPDWLWEQVRDGQLTFETLVCEMGTEDWLPFRKLPDGVFSLHVLAEFVQINTGITEAEQLHKQAEQLHSQAQNRLFECQTNVEVYQTRNAQTKQTALNGLEFINAALKLEPNNPNYLNIKALLLADGLGDKESGLAYLKEAAREAPESIQIRQNLRDLTKRSEGCLVILIAGGLGLCSGYLIMRVCFG